MIFFVFFLILCDFFADFARASLELLSKGAPIASSLMIMVSLYEAYECRKEQFYENFTSKIRCYNPERKQEKCNLQKFLPQEIRCYNPERKQEKCNLQKFLPQKIRCYNPERKRRREWKLRFLPGKNSAFLCISFLSKQCVQEPFSNKW